MLIKTDIFSPAQYKNENALLDRFILMIPTDLIEQVTFFFFFF